MGLFSERPGVTPEVIVDAKDGYYFAYDASHPIFRVDAELDGRAPPTLTVTAQSRLPDGRRSSVLHAGRQLQAALAHFEGRASRVHCLWTERLPENLNELNALSAAEPAAPLDDLVARTWSGRHLVAAGYRRVEVAHVDGQPGAYRFVEAYFWK